MLDIQLLRKDLDGVAKRLADRGYTLDVAAFTALEAERRDTQTRTEEMQARRNTLSKQIGGMKGRGRGYVGADGGSGRYRRRDEGVGGQAGRYPEAFVRPAARRAQPAARKRARRQGRNRERRSAPLGHAAQVRFPGEGSRRRRHAARPPRRYRRETVGRAFHVAAWTDRATASRAGAVHDRHAHAASRVYRG